MAHRRLLWPVDERASIEPDGRVPTQPAALRTAEDEIFRWLQDREAIDKITISTPEGVSTVETELRKLLVEHRNRQVHVRWWLE